MIKCIHIIICLALLLSACNKNVVVINDVVDYKKIDKDKQLEYNYALTEATKQNLLGNHRQAAALYRKCIDANPEGDAAMYQLSKIFFRFQDKGSAITYAKKAIDIEPNNFWYLYHLSQLYLFFYENENAIKVYEEIVKEFPENKEMIYELSILYYDNQRYNDALIRIEELENEVGHNNELSLKKHSIYVKLNDFEKAESSMRELIERNPNEIKYYGMLAELYSNNNKDKLANKFYKKVFQIDKNNGLAQLSYAQYLYSRAMYDSSFIYYKKAFMNKKLKYEFKVEVIATLISDNERFMVFNEYLLFLIEILLDENEKDVRVNSLMSDYYYKKKEYDTSISYLKLVVGQSNENIRAWDQLLYLLNSQKEYDDLIKYSEMAISSYKEEARFYLMKGLAETKMNRIEDAIKTLNSGVRYVGKNRNLEIQMYTFLGDNYNRIGEFDKSDISFEKVLQIDPNNIVVMNNYSYYLSIRGVKLDYALKMMKVVIESEPKNSTYLDTYAWVLFKLKKYKSAKKIIVSALEYGGWKNPTIVEHYADILYANGDIEKAVFYWKEAKRLGSKSTQLESKILEHEQNN